MPRPGTFCCIKIQRSQAAIWLGSMRCSGAGPRRVVEAGHAVRQPDATLFHHPRRAQCCDSPSLAADPAVTQFAKFDIANSGAWYSEQSHYSAILAQRPKSAMRHSALVPASLILGSALGSSLNFVRNAAIASCRWDERRIGPSRNHCGPA